MDELDYEKHLNDFKSLLGAQSLGAAKQAQKSHALAVFNPLRDWIGKSISIAQQLTNQNARYYMRFGAGRRLRMIFYAYREIIFTADPERDNPLSHDEQLELSRDVNILYMNVRGVLDNFAWCFLYEKEPGAINSISRTDVDLFSTKFRKLPCFSKIKQEIYAHDDWNKEVKERRDPVAHRIPLYIPPSILTEEEAETYNELNNEATEEAANFNFDEADSRVNQLYNIGTFFPYFQHHPDQGFIPIYPTIPTDMVHLIRIGDVIGRSLEEARIVEEQFHQ
jgi:hypothetical protein